jgi:hypothetical protein
LPLKKNITGEMSHKISLFATEKEHQWQNESEDTSFCLGVRFQGLLTMNEQTPAELSCHWIIGGLSSIIMSRNDRIIAELLVLQNVELLEGSK